MSNNGCILINNEQIILTPVKNKINSYCINSEKIKFIINNNYIVPLLKSYIIKLPNCINLKKNDKINIKINIPKQIYINNYIYSLDYIIEDLYNDCNFYAQLKLKSLNNIYTISRSQYNENELTVQENNGWINFNIKYKVGENLYNNIKKIDNLSEIIYSLNFSPKKLIFLSKNNSNTGTIFNVELFLELENGEYIEDIEYKKCKEIIIPFENNNDSNENNLYKLKIIGPEIFKYLIIKEGNDINIDFIKINKTLIIQTNLSFFNNNLFINVLRENFNNNNFYFYLLNKNEIEIETIFSIPSDELKIAENTYKTKNCSKNITKPNNYGIIINNNNNNIINQVNNLEINLNNNIEKIDNNLNNINNIFNTLELHLPSI